MYSSSLVLQLPMPVIEIKEAEGKGLRSIGRGMDVNLDQRSGRSLSRPLSDVASIDDDHVNHGVCII